MPGRLYPASGVIEKEFVANDLMRSLRKMLIPADAITIIVESMIMYDLLVVLFIDNHLEGEE